MHSRDYRNSSHLVDHDVLVVGSGNSALDIAVEAGRAAKINSSKKRFYDSARHTMEVDFDNYKWQLERELKRGAKRKMH